MKSDFFVVKKLSVCFTSNNLETINNLSFGLKRGASLAILGPSGCGKTTLLNTILDLNKNEIRKEGEIKYSGKIRIVFQEPRLLPWYSVWENIVFGLNSVETLSQKDEIDRLIRFFGLEDFKEYLPGKISLGMKQRVNLARALVTKPDILLLDEPFSSLDVKTKKNIIEDLKKIITEKKITTIFVTHSWEEAFKMADQILVLSKRPAKRMAILNKNDYSSYTKAKKALNLANEQD